MDRTIVALTAVITFVLGAAAATVAAPAVPAAAADPGAAPPGAPVATMTRMHDAGPAEMEAMHVAMRGHMPPDMRAACDEMHTGMADMHSGMSADRAPLPDQMPSDHADHHARRRSSGGVR